MLTRMLTRRVLMILLGAIALGVGLAFSFGPPRITLLNAALRIDHPWRHSLAAAVAFGGAAGLAAAARRPLLRGLAVAAAALLAAQALHLALFRLEADTAGLRSRGLFGGVGLEWGEVRRVESGPEVVVVWGAGDSQIRVDTSRFEPGQRATFDRTVARRVREAQPERPRRGESGTGG
jgi:hypothetical protein